MWWNNKTATIPANYIYLKLQFDLTQEAFFAGKIDDQTPILVTNLVSGHNWMTPLNYTVFFILSGFKNIEKNERLLEINEHRRLFSKESSESFEGYFPVDQLVFQQLKCPPYNLGNLPEYEIHPDQRSRIFCGIGGQKLWLAVLNEQDLALLEKHHKPRRGDMVLEITSPPKQKQYYSSGKPATENQRYGFISPN